MENCPLDNERALRPDTPAERLENGFDPQRAADRPEECKVAPAEIVPYRVIGPLLELGPSDLIE